MKKQQFLIWYKSKRKILFLLVWIFFLFSNIPNTFAKWKYKSIVFDFQNNQWNISYIGIREIDFYKDGIKIEITDSDYNATATSTSSNSYSAKYAFNTSLNLKGSRKNTSRFWYLGQKTNQRLIFTTLKDFEFDEIKFNNIHNNGGSTNMGAKETKIYLSAEEATDTTYQADINKMKLIFNWELPEHSNQNTIQDYKIPITENWTIIMANEGINNITPAKSCLAIKQNDSSAPDGKYRIQTNNMSSAEQYYCDMTNAWGGWMLIFQRAWGTWNRESCWSTLNDFLHNTCWDLDNLEYGDSYSSNLTNLTNHSFWEYLVLNYDSNGNIDDDSFIVQTDKNIFPDNTSGVDFDIKGVCNQNNENCDTSDVKWKYIGDHWYAGAQCYKNHRDYWNSYHGDYGYCPNGWDGWQSNRSFWNRSGYDEVKLWGHPNNARFYQERVFIRYTSPKPTDITLSNNTFDSTLATPIVVWILTTEDESINDTHTYTFIWTNNNNNDFSISGNQLLLNNINSATLIVTIRSTDSTGQYTEKGFYIEAEGTLTPWTSTNPITSCQQLKDDYPNMPSWIYRLKNSNMTTAIQVYCDQETTWWGWMLLFKRAGWTTNTESCWWYLNAFLHSECWSTYNLDYNDSYSIDVDKAMSEIWGNEYMFIQKSANNTISDDSYNIKSDTPLFPNTYGDLQEIPYEKICNINKENCDDSDGYWLYAGTSWFNSAYCDWWYAGPTNLKWNYGYCNNGITSHYQANSLYGSRAWYNETKLRAHSNSAQNYSEFVYIRDYVKDETEHDPLTDFVTTWETTTTDETITIPTNWSYSYYYKIDCDDDWIFEFTGVNGDGNCSFATTGNHKIRISGTFPSIYFNNAWDKNKILEINQWGTITRKTMLHAFHGAENIELLATDTPDLGNATDISSMFQWAKNIGKTSSTWNWNWNTSSITNMNRVFYGANNFDKNINSWNTNNVTSMISLFQGTNKFNQPLNNWDTSKVTRMNGMFGRAYIFNQDLSTFDTSSVIDMNHMFYNAKAFNQELSWWNINNVTNMQGMFQNANVFDQDISNWCVLQISSKPSDFDSNTLASWTENEKPSWGSCGSVDIITTWWIRWSWIHLYQRVTNNDQTLEYTFSDYFKISDTKWANSGRYTTVSISNLIGIHSNEIIPSNTNIQFKWWAIETLTGDNNTRVKIGNNIINYNFITTPETFILRESWENNSKKGIYGSKPIIKIIVPAYQTLDTYKATLTFTLYEN